MIMLILFALIALAIMYGLFFIVFKLIWILFKNKRNLWPLILAGVCTGLFVLFTVLAAVKTYHAVVRPFTPIMEALASSSAPAAGPHAFVTEDWSMVIFDGMVFSTPIHWDELTAYIGIDTNALRKPQDQQNLENFQALAVIKYDANKPVSADEAHQTLLNILGQDGRIQIEETSYSEDKQFLLAKGRAYAQHGTFNFLVLNTAQEDDVYYVIALGQNDLSVLQASLNTFRLTKQH